MHAIIIGIDPSMRSTGICIYDGSVHKYELICSTATKKVQSFTHPNFKLRMYEPVPIKGKTGVGKEFAKTCNVSSVVREVSKILDEYKPDYVTIESIALNACGVVDELAGLNYSIRLECLRRGIQVWAITPTSNKMEFSGNGQATKDMMVASWEACEPECSVYNILGKHKEDLADAYALCHYPLEKLNVE